MNKNNSDWGNLSPLLTNKISDFLNVKEIMSLRAVNERLHENIQNNPFIQKRIVDAKLTPEKIYDIVHEVALSEYEKSFWRNGDGRGPNGEYYFSSEKFNNSLGRCLKNLGNCRDKTPMVTMLEQWMFLEVLSMDKNLFSSNKPSEQVIKDYLVQYEMQERRKEFLEQSYKLDKEDTRWISAFRNFNKIYFDQLSKTKKWDKKTKNIITSKFIKFWLYQGSKIEDLTKNRNVEEYNWPTFSNACKKLKRSFFDSKRTFSIDFKEFISQLTAKELNEYLFENKYYFVDHFKNEIVNNVEFICEQVLSKNKNLPDFNEENITGKFKKLLSNLGINSKLIDEQMIDLSEEETNLSNEAKSLEVAAPLCDGKMSNKTIADLSKEEITPPEKTDVITPSDHGNNVEIGLIQKIFSAIKKFFGFDDREAAPPVTVEKNENNETHEFFSKPTGDTPAMFDGQKNEGLVK